MPNHTILENMCHYLDRKFKICFPSFHINLCFKTNNPHTTFNDKLFNQYLENHVNKSVEGELPFSHSEEHFQVTCNLYLKTLFNLSIITHTVRISI